MTTLKRLARALRMLLYYYLGTVILTSRAAGRRLYHLLDFNKS